MGNVKTLAALSLITFAVCIILIISISLATAADIPQHILQNICASVSEKLSCANFQQ